MCTCGRRGHCVLQAAAGAHSPDRNSSPPQGGRQMSATLATGTMETKSFSKVVKDLSSWSEGQTGAGTASDPGYLLENSAWLNAGLFERFSASLAKRRSSDTFTSNKHCWWTEIFVLTCWGEKNPPFHLPTGRSCSPSCLCRLSRRKTSGLLCLLWKSSQRAASDLKRTLICQQKAAITTLNSQPQSRRKTRRIKSSSIMF